MRNIKIEIGETSTTQAAKPFPGLTAEEEAQVEATAKAEWARNPKERASFADNFGAFLAYHKANKAGRVKILGGHHV